MAERSYEMACACGAAMKLSLDGASEAFAAEVDRLADLWRAAHDGDRCRPVSMREAWNIRRLGALCRCGHRHRKGSLCGAVMSANPIAPESLSNCTCGEGA